MLQCSSQPRERQSIRLIMYFLITAPQAYRRALQQMDFTPGTTGRGGRESTGAKTLIAALARNDNTPGSVTHFSVRRETAHAPKWRLDRKSTRLNSSHLGISYAV